ncbi:MAG: hypothetical protein CVU87_06845 [Firmicutes bacterium HGW-Firmicutes-12]|jgi:hypothetical protein|nr:MAG: hypothetical protein CVU87_06845 [Firmicutes bacterium HGW-Firmicutes-12]
MAVFLPVLQVISIVLIGFVVGRVFEIHRKTLSSLVLYVFLPTFVFKGLYLSSLRLDDVLSLIGSNIAMYLLLIATAVLAGRVLGFPDKYKSALNMGSTFINAGNMGIPTVIFAFGVQVSGFAVVNAVMGTIVFNTVGIYIASGGKNNLKDTVKSVLRLPTIYAVLFAFICNLFHFQLPTFIMNPLTTIAGAFVPIILILLGTQLACFSGIKSIPLIITGTTIRLLISPIFAIIISFVFKLSPEIAQVFILQMAMPTAVNTLIMTMEFNGDADIIAGIVFFTTILSVLTVPFWLSFLLN